MRKGKAIEKEREINEKRSHFLFPSSPPDSFSCSFSFSAPFSSFSFLLRAPPMSPRVASQPSSSILAPKRERTPLFISISLSPKNTPSFSSPSPSSSILRSRERDSLFSSLSLSLSLSAKILLLFGAPPPPPPPPPPPLLVGE